MSPIITALTGQKRNPHRVNVFVDGEYAFSLAKIVAAWLEVGQEINEQRMATLLAEDQKEQALQQAIRLIQHRPRSQSEVRRNLEKHNFSAEVIEETLSRLVSNGLLDDRKFASLWVENRLTFRPRGQRALAYELRQLGITDPIIQETLEETLPDEEMLAYAAAQKYVRKLVNLERQDFYRKLSNFLARRGFNYETAAAVVERLWQETAGENTTPES
jgi:regulatory protein